MKLLSSDVVELEHEYKHLSEVVKSVKENSEDILAVSYTHLTLPTIA